MGIDDFSNSFSSEHIDKFGKQLLDKHGLDACEAAEQINDTYLSEGTLRTYKPQIRNIISELEDIDPDVDDVIQLVKQSDKTSATKNTMLSSIKIYYEQIGSTEKAEMIKSISDSDDISISKEPDEDVIDDNEIDQIEQYILPDIGENRIIESGDEAYKITGEHTALTYIILYTDCRVDEICKRYSDDSALTVEDIDLENQSIDLDRVKMYIPDKLVHILEQYIDNLDGDKILFDFTTRTAQKRIADVNGAYQFAFGSFENIDKLTPSKLAKVNVADIADDVEEDEDDIDEIMEKLNVDNIDELEDKIENIR